MKRVLPPTSWYGQKDPRLNVARLKKNKPDASLSHYDWLHYRVITDDDYGNRQWISAEQAQKLLSSGEAEGYDAKLALGLILGERSRNEKI